MSESGQKAAKAMTGMTGMPLPSNQNYLPDRYLTTKTDDPLGLAFPEKFTVHAGQAGTPYSGSEAASIYHELLDKPGGPCAIYVHLPFCQGKCLYCGFAGSFPGQELTSNYAKAVKRELEFLAQKPAACGPVRTIYFGGGTPSCLDPGDLALLMETIFHNFSLANDCEITLEGRIHDFTPERRQAFLASGFNRFSIGIQSFDTLVRRKLGRVSDKQTASELLAGLCDLNRANVIIDLIYGLPGQDVETFLADLALADQCGVDGLDTYQLNVFGDLKRAVEAGRVPAPAELKEQGRYYIAAANYFTQKHWRRLSLSHYARSTRERNIYNPWAKRRDRCLAAGAGAGGFLDGHATYRLPVVEGYILRSMEGNFDIDFVTSPSPAAPAISFIVGQMEEGYLDFEELNSRFGVNPGPLERLLVNWRESGLVELGGKTMTMTMEGLFWGVNLTQAVVDTAANNLQGENR
ncbi:MAG: heme anaerobic degradation radical SAM methyltransferase ChuW/HutW [Deltaproteobacteria bacterium]|jgi:oxygen-independent coproporphyrinogen-3 oxidase|nr:heme anaerobic degradation radical SAM methyltransferase ChuW/HutW [Deltaproteobacteria bacterium]